MSSYFNNLPELPDSPSGSKSTAMALDAPNETNIDDEGQAAELRALKIAHLEIESKIVQGEKDIRDGTLAKESTESKLSKLKTMGAMGLASAISSGFQSFDVSVHQIMEHYMSVVIPHTLLGLEIAIKEGNKMDIEGYKRALPRIEFEMKEHVQARLDQSKREIVQKCEKRALELIELAAADL